MRLKFNRAITHAHVRVASSRPVHLNAKAGSLNRVGHHTKDSDLRQRSFFEEAHCYSSEV